MLQAFAAEHPEVLQELLPAAADADDAQERASLCREAAAYLARELAQGESEGGLTWAASGSGQDLAAALERSLDSGGQVALPGRRRPAGEVAHRPPVGQRLRASPGQRQRRTPGQRGRRRHLPGVRRRAPSR